MTSWNQHTSQIMTNLWEWGLKWLIAFCPLRYPLAIYFLSWLQTVGFKGHCSAGDREMGIRHVKLSHAHYFYQVLAVFSWGKKNALQIFSRLWLIYRFMNNWILTISASVVITFKEMIFFFRSPSFIFIIFFFNC